MIGVLADRHGRKLFIVLAQAFAAVPIVFLMLFVLNPTHGLFLFLYYVTNGVSGVFNTMALAMAYVADVSPIQLDRGPGFAFVLASFGLAIMIGPSIGGFVPPKLAAYLAVAFAGGVLLYAGFVVPETLKKTLACVEWKGGLRCSCVRGSSLVMVCCCSGNICGSPSCPGTRSSR